MTNTSQPKAFFNLGPSINLFRYIPIKIPIIANAEKERRKTQLISICKASPKKPIKEFIAIINNEVAAAFLIGSFARNNKIGTIMKPPPAPTRPVTIPVKTPKEIKLK